MQKLPTDLVSKPFGTIRDLFNARCERSPERQFVTWKRRSWSYAEAWDEAAKVTGFLTAQGIGPGSRVASLLGRSPEGLWLWFGVAASGATYIPLDSALSGDLLRDRLTRAEPDLLFLDDGSRRVLSTQLPPRCRAVVLLAEEPASGSSVPVFDRSALANMEPSGGVAVAPGDIAVIDFTSGTTGRPKAARLPQNAFYRNPIWMVATSRFAADDVFHDWTPQHHLFNQMDNVMGAVAAGASLAMVPHFSRSRFWGEVQESGATICVGFAAMASYLMSNPENSADVGHTLTRGIIAGLHPDLAARFTERFGVQVLNPFGGTEAEWLTVPVDGVTPNGSCGVPAPDFELAILNENDVPVAPGAIGRLAFRPRVPFVSAQGYEDDAAYTVENWRNLWHHTQDLGRMDDVGLFYFVDRLKNSIRTRGENVAPGEVEEVVRKHPDIADCAVLGAANERGDEDIRILLVGRRQTNPHPAVLWRFCRDSLPKYMLPRFIEFVEALPYTELGKLNRNEIPAVGRRTWDYERHKASLPA